MKQIEFVAHLENVFNGEEVCEQRCILKIHNIPAINLFSRHRLITATGVVGRLAVFSISTSGAHLFITLPLL